MSQRVQNYYVNMNSECSYIGYKMSCFFHYTNLTSIANEIGIIRFVAEFLSLILCFCFVYRWFFCFCLLFVFTQTYKASTIHTRTIVFTLTHTTDSRNPQYNGFEPKGKADTQTKAEFSILSQWMTENSCIVRELKVCMCTKECRTRVRSRQSIEMRWSGLVWLCCLSHISFCFRFCVFFSRIHLLVSLSFVQSFINKCLFAFAASSLFLNVTRTPTQQPQRSLFCACTFFGCIFAIIFNFFRLFVSTFDNVRQFEWVWCDL